MSKRSTALRLLGFRGDEESISRKDLRKGFRRKARECHPDKNPRASPSDFQELVDALDFLENHDDEPRYDNQDEYASSSSSTKLVTPYTRFHSADLVDYQFGLVYGTRGNAARRTRCFSVPGE